MVNPLYTSENAPRAIRGALTGLYQFMITIGIMLAFWINYGAELHVHGVAQYAVPLAMQALPAALLLVGMLLSNESPRWLAKQDRWEEARAVLCRIRNLPQDHPYMETEFQGIVAQLEHERQLVGGSGFWDLMREMWTIPGNRNRALITIFIMICQQMTGTNASKSSPSLYTLHLWKVSCGDTTVHSMHYSQIGRNRARSTDTTPGT